MVAAKVHHRRAARVTEFAIYRLAAGGGTLALSPMPGRTGAYAADRARLLAWGPALVISMTPLAELARNGAAGLPDDLAAAGTRWRHLPVADFGAPGRDVQAAWPAVQVLVLEILAQGNRVLVHCHGGCGRSGMAVLRLMIAAGEAPGAALTRLRLVRPCAVETEAQLDWAKGISQSGLTANFR